MQIGKLLQIVTKKKLEIQWLEMSLEVIANLFWMVTFIY